MPIQFQTVQVLNYKSFRDSGEITLDARFNVIVGKNDAGKSAFVEALSLQAQSKPHRTHSIVPEPGSPTNSKSLTIFSIYLTPEDLTKLLSIRTLVCVPYKHKEEDQESAFARFQDAIAQGGKFVIRWTNGKATQGYFETYGDCEPKSEFIYIKNPLHPHGFEPVFQGHGTLNGASLTDIVAGAFASRIYTFRAERLNIGECRVGSNKSLKPDASNLAEVLNVLISSNPKKHERFLESVRTVFQHITEISAPLISDNIASVMIWSDSSEREDLAVSLSESGTGIGQVLAILYVVVTSDSPKVIIIDEPQSFLHPGAVRKLLEVLREYPQHQYIITTHSPTAVAATGAESLIQVRRDGYESVIDSISARNANDLRLFLADVGASLSDVFGADKVLWVEGKTEEMCFPILIRKLNQTPLLGLQIVAVQNTGDLEGKLASRVFDIYNRLTSAHTLLPPAIAFILDREGKSKRAMEEINRKSSNQVCWLPRRMYENYLLDPESIVRVINEDDTQREAEITIQDVEDWIDLHATDPEYFDLGTPAAPYPSNDWKEKVHAANLLADLFSQLTDQRVSYQKVRHGLRITESLISEPTPAILELSDFLKSVLTERSDTSAA